MRFLSFDTTALAKAFAVRNFAIYTAGSSISQIGMWVQRLAIGWLVWDLTKSGVWLGAVAIAEFLPTMVITPLGGVLSDRLDRRMVSLVTQAISGGLAIVLWLLTIYGVVEAWHVIAMVFLWGVLTAVNQSSRIALVPTMVPREVLGQAIAISAVTFNLARFLGPVIAGALIVTAGIGWTFFVNAVSYIPLLIVLSRLDLPAPKPRNNSGLIEEMIEGFRYTVSHDAIASLMTVMALAAIFTRATIELLPAFADEVFAQGSTGLAAFTSAGGLGAIVAGLWLAQRATQVGLTAWVLATLLVNAGAIIVFAMTGNFYVAVAMMAVSGFCNVASGTASQTLVQISVEDAMRGRVMSLWLIINRGGPAFGAMVFGAVSERLGWGWPTAIGSAVTILVAAWVIRRRGALAARLETPPPDRADSKAPSAAA